MILCTYVAVFPILKWNFTQVHFSLKLAIRKSWITLSTHNSSAEGYGCKTHKTDSEDSSYWHKVVLLAVVNPRGERRNICVPVHDGSDQQICSDRNPVNGFIVYSVLARSYPPYCWSSNGFIQEVHCSNLDQCPPIVIEVFHHGFCYFL